MKIISNKFPKTKEYYESLLIKKNQWEINNIEEKQLIILEKIYGRPILTINRSYIPKIGVGGNIFNIPGEIKYNFIYEDNTK